MSRIAKNTSKPTEIKKPYCKVCFDAGKPESEYTSHWVRTLPDRSGKTTVTCPTLLDTECRYCYNFGHTTKFCPAIEQQEKERERADRKAKAEVLEKKKPKIQEKKSGSVFAALMDSDSEDETPAKVSKVSKPVEKFPVLCTQVKKIKVELPKPKQEAKSGWAAIVAKPAEEKKVEPAKRTGLVMLSDYIKVDVKNEEKKVEVAKASPWAATRKEPVITKSWADWSDSEDEDEEDDYEPYKPYDFGDAAEDVDETW